MSAPEQLGRRVDTALDDLTSSVPTDGVADRIRSRADARRRRRSRRVATAGLTVTLLVVAGAAVIGLRAPDEVRTTAADPVDGPPAAETDDPIDDVVRRELPGTGPRASLVASDGDTAWFTRGETTDDSRAAPDTVTAARADGTIGPSTQVQGVPSVGAADTARLWLLVDETPGAPAGTWRLKEIDRADGRLLSSRVLDLPGRPRAAALLGSGLVVSTDAATVAVDPSTGSTMPVDGSELSAATPETPATTGLRLEGVDVVADS